MKIFLDIAKNICLVFFCGISDRNVNYVLRFLQIKKNEKMKELLFVLKHQFDADDEVVNVARHDYLLKC